MLHCHPPDLTVLPRVSLHQMGSSCRSCRAPCPHPSPLERFGSHCPKVVFPVCHTEKHPPLMWDVGRGPRDSACHVPGVLPIHFSLSMPRTYYKSGWRVVISTHTLQ